MKKHAFRPLSVAGLVAGLTALVLVTGTGGVAGATGTATPDPVQNTATCREQRPAVRDTPLRVVPAWAAGDADAFAGVFMADASFIVYGEDTYLKTRDEIRAYMATMFAGPLAGTRVAATVLDVKCVTNDVGVVITEGGILFPGQTEPLPEFLSRQTWVVVRSSPTWRVTAYSNSHLVR